MAVHFLDAREGQCRFPLWGPDKSIGDVCGASTMPGHSYCPACHSRAHAPSAPRAPYVPRDPHVSRSRIVAEDVTPDLVELVA